MKGDTLNRKTSGLIAALCMLVLALTVPVASVSAASVGACGDSSTQHYVNGNYKSGNETGTIERVQASMSITDSTRFKPCTPDDNAGANGSTVSIVMFRPVGATPHVEAGITRCVRGGVACDGTPHFFSEWQDVIGASVIRDLGPASYNTAYTVMIDLDGPAHQAQVYVDGVLKTTWAVGGDLNPGDDPHLYYKTETWDRGDGLGTVANATNIGQMKYRTQGVWWNRSSSCNIPGASGQINCHTNGSYGLFFETSDN